MSCCVLSKVMISLQYLLMNDPYIANVSEKCQQIKIQSMVVEGVPAVKKKVIGPPEFIPPGIMANDVRIGDFLSD